MPTPSPSTDPYLERAGRWQMVEDRLRELYSRPAVKRAIEYGIDVTLLIENLRRTPTERLRWHQQVLDSMVALREEVQGPGRRKRVG